MKKEIIERLEKAMLQRAKEHKITIDTLELEYEQNTSGDIEVSYESGNKDILARWSRYGDKVNSFVTITKEHPKEDDAQS